MRSPIIFTFLRAWPTRVPFYAFGKSTTFPEGESETFEAPFFRIGFYLGDGISNWVTSWVISPSSRRCFFISSERRSLGYSICIVAEPRPILASMSSFQSYRKICIFYLICLICGELKSIFCSAQQKRLNLIWLSGSKTIGTSDSYYDGCMDLYAWKLILVLLICLKYFKIRSVNFEKNFNCYVVEYIFVYQYL